MAGFYSVSGSELAGRNVNMTINRILCQGFKAPYVTESAAGGREDERSQCERSLSPCFPSPSSLVHFDTSERYEDAL